jgi:hypothetical protein
MFLSAISEAIVLGGLDESTYRPVADLVRLRCENPRLSELCCC